MSEDADATAEVVPSLTELFLGFAMVAAFAFGGVLPWVRYVVVDKRRWLKPDEFLDMLALCQLLPGPNVVNMSIALGARFHGPLGSLAASLGLLGLPITLVLLIATVYGRFAEVAAVQNALASMGAAAAGLIVAMAVKFAEPMLRTRFWTTAPIIGLTFVAVGFLHAPLWVVIPVMAPLAIALAWRVR